MKRPRPLAEDFSIGWICPLPVERAAAEVLLDEQYDDCDWCHGPFVLGRIGGHHVVLGYLPAGFMGTNPAAVIATQMASTFTQIQMRLLVGIGGGVPSAGADVRLGDVVVSQPGKGHGGVVQYDFGKAIDGQFQRTGHLHAPPKALLEALAEIQTRGFRKTCDVWGHLRAFDKLPHYTRVHAGPDLLFRAESKHLPNETCERCCQELENMLVSRSPRPSLDPVIHCGIIASGNQVMRDGVTRDRLSRELGGALCFEMEAAGLLNEFPALIIRGICDYSDSHKNKRWQAYAAATAAACAREILSILPAVWDPRSTPPASESIFQVPFPRDKFFVGREAILSKIESHLQRIDQVDHRRTAIVGLGGIGKSQVAIEYTYQAREHTPMSIFWVHASNPSRFRQGYHAIAELAQLPGRGDPQVNILRLVHRWLSEPANGSWLMVLDNVDDDDVFFSIEEDHGTGENCLPGQKLPLEAFLPQCPHGSILVTSRNFNAASNLVADFGPVVGMEAMTDDEALRLLETRMSLAGHQEDAMALVRMLDKIPLAIIHAATYITRRQRVNISRYLQLFRESEENQVSLLTDGHARDIRRDFSNRSPAITTWQITFDQIRSHNPHATDLLALMSLYDRQGVPGYLLQSDMAPLRFENALAPLTSFALIREQVSNGSFEMHRLVQLAMRQWLASHREKSKWLSEALRILARVIPSGKYEDWPTCRELFPHARQLLERRFAVPRDVLNWTRISNKIGRYLWGRGEHVSSRKIIHSALETAEVVLGPEHRATLNTANNLAIVLQCEGRYDEAEPLNRRALAGREKVLGLTHPITLTSVRSLARIFRWQGKYEEAELLARRALEGKEQILGAEHPDTLECANGLAVVLQDRGRYCEAEAFNRRALEGREKTIGPEHPDTLDSVSNLAWALQSQGKFHEAMSLARRALEGRERVLGSVHPDTLHSVQSLARFLDRQGRFGEAEQLCRRALEGSEQVYGSENPHTWKVLSELATVLRGGGKYTEAEKLSRRALDGRKQAFGLEHPDTLCSVDHLVSILYCQGKYQDAEPLDRQALEGREKALGPEHPDTLGSVSNLAALLLSQGQYDEAESLNRRALAGRERVLGPNHPDTLGSANNLAAVLQSQDRYHEAEPLNRRVLKEYQQVLGPDHPETLGSISNLAGVLQGQRRYSEAVRLNQRALDGRNRVLGETHPDTLMSISNLAETYQDQQRWAEAEEIGWQVVETSKTVLGLQHPETLVRTGNLAKTYHAQGRYDLARQLMTDCVKALSQAVGADHPDTVACLTALSTWEAQSREAGFPAPLRRPLEYEET